MAQIPEDEPMLEAYIKHPRKFLKHDQATLRDRMDRCIDKLKESGKGCIVIVAHSILIGELSTRLGIREQDAKRRIGIVSKHGTKYERGIWLRNCEVQSHQVDLTAERLEAPLNSDAPTNAARHALSAAAEGSRKTGGTGEGGAAAELETQEKPKSCVQGSVDAHLNVHKKLKSRC